MIILTLENSILLFTNEKLLPYISPYLSAKNRAKIPILTNFQTSENKWAREEILRLSIREE